MNLLTFAALSAFVLPTFAPQQPQIAQQPQPQSHGQAVDEFTRANAVPFAQGKTGPLLSDLYLPTGPGPFPAIVFIHGGGWSNGDRTQMTKVIEFLVPHGYVGMAIDYDLSPGVHFPTALYESKEAIRWLRAHAAQYHVDPNRIAVAGSSAGGEIAALVALTSGNPKFEGDGGFKEFPSTVKAAILYNAALNLTAFPDNDESILRYIGSSCSANKTACSEASPQFQIRTNMPPFYIGHGDMDKSVPYSQFTAFVAAFKKANGRIVEFTAEGGPHTYWSKPQWFQPNAEATLDFLQKNLK
jgi:acetyl esterase/lipase